MYMPPEGPWLVSHSYFLQPSGPGSENTSIEKLRVRNDTKEVSVAQTSTLNFTLEIREADGTCIHQRYRTPPIIPHATVDTPYHYNLYKRAWVIYANYTCEEGYHLQNNQSRYMFCQSYKWTSPDSPVCVKGIFPNSQVVYKTCIINIIQPNDCCRYDLYIFWFSYFSIM